LHTRNRVLETTSQWVGWLARTLLLRIGLRGRFLVQPTIGRQAAKTSTPLRRSRGVSGLNLADKRPNIDPLRDLPDSRLLPKVNIMRERTDAPQYKRRTQTLYDRNIISFSTMVFTDTPVSLMPVSQAYVFRRGFLEYHYFIQTELPEH
jgi:hypothetical protein